MSDQFSTVILAAIALFLIFLLYYFSDAVHALKYADFPVLSFLDDGVWIRKIVSSDKTFLRYSSITKVEKYQSRGGSGIIIYAKNNRYIVKSTGLNIKNEILYNIFLSQMSKI
jgi:hypothetical protein